MGRRRKGNCTPQKKKKTNLVWSDETKKVKLIKGAKHQKEITIINLYVPNVSASNVNKHTLKGLKAYRDPNTMVVGHFITPLSPIDMSSKQKNHQRNPRPK
jgi:hypothetical protein